MTVPGRRRTIRRPPARRGAPGGVTDARFAAHLATAGSLVAAQRFGEAEVEVLRALERWPPICAR